MSKSIHNPPGQNQIDYRVGTQAEFVETMLVETYAQADQGQGNPQPSPLKHLNVKASNDLTLPLLKAWAVVGDILTFYQERIAHEGFLRTAVEHLSFLEMSKTLHYTPNPGVGAATHVAFHVFDVKGAPQKVPVPANTPVQSMPKHGEMPVVFENDSPFEAHAKLNTLKPYIPQKVIFQKIHLGTEVILLEGSQSSSHLGDYLLLLDLAPPPKTKSWAFRRIKKIEEAPKREYIRVILESISQTGTTTTPDMQQPVVFCFKQQLHLFGFNAPPWSPKESKKTHDASEPHVPANASQETEWPHFQLASNSIDVVRARPNIQTGSYLVLYDQHTSPALSQMIQVQKDFITQCTAFSKTEEVTRIEFEPLPVLANFHRRSTLVFAQSEKLDLYAPQVPLWEPFFGSQCQLSGALHELKKDQAISVAGALPYVALSARPGGIFTYAQQRWSVPILRGTAITALAQDHHQQIVVGTPQGVYHLSTATPTLDSLGHVLSLTTDAQGQVYAGTTQGVFTYDQKQWKSLGLTSHQAQTLLATPSQGLLVGTQQGLFQYLNQHWNLVGLVKQSIQTLCLTPQQTLYVGTEKTGVYCCQNMQLTQWEPLNHGLFNQNTCVLGQDAHGHLYAGTQGGGVFRWNGHQWDALNRGLTHPHIRCFLAHSDGTLYVGTQGGGLFFSKNQGLQWEPLSVGLSNDVRALLSEPNGTLQVGTGNTCYLSAFDPLSLEAIQENPLFAINIRFAEDLKKKTISSGLADAFKKNNIVLSKEATVWDLTSEHSWLIKNGDKSSYVVDRGTHHLHVCVKLPLQATSAPTAVRVPSQTRQWSLQMEGGFAGTVTAFEGEIEYDFSSIAKGTVSEVVTVASTVVSNTNQFTSVHLHTPLKHVYHPESVVINGNVIRATHGETVQQEVLGSGNTGEANQQFTLQRAPVIHTFPTHGAPAQSTLKVASHTEPSTFRPSPDKSSPSPIQWQQTKRMVEENATSRAYMATTNHHGKTTVSFGNGTMGARLPSGSGNLVANYRTGRPEEGNLETGSLTVPKNPPTGIHKVTHPIPATGGKGKETNAELVHSLPLSVQTLERIVSQTDYENFVRAFPGIDKVQSQTVWNGKTHLMHLTVAGTVQKSKTLPRLIETQLLPAIYDCRMHPLPLQIDPFVTIYFNLTTKLLIDSDKSPQTLHTEIIKKLTQSFGFHNTPLSHSVNYSEVVTQLQDFPFVKATEITGLYFTGASPSLQSYLEAKTAFWDEKYREIQPAQLLLINPAKGGIQLTLEEAA